MQNSGFKTEEENNKIVLRYKKSSDDEREVFLNWMAREHKDIMCMHIMNQAVDDDCCRGIVQEIAKIIKKGEK